MDKTEFIKKMRNNIYSRIRTLGGSIQAETQEREGHDDEVISDDICLRCIEIEHLIELLDILRDYDKSEEVKVNASTEVHFGALNIHTT